ncbi:MAG: APC family permease [Anaerolineaceae bacterium]|nr:APC family permease [Anaerolineaceae bacterium]
MTEAITQIEKGKSESRGGAQWLLVRTLGFPGVLVFTISSIGLCYLGWLHFSAIAGLFPASDLGGILLVMFVVAALLSVVYSAIGAVAPFYGADYRLASRVLSAPLSFASSLTFLVLFSFIAGSLITSIFTNILPGFIKILAAIIFEKSLQNQAGAVSAPYAAALFGTTLLLLVFLFLILPSRTTHRVLMVGLGFSLLAWIMLFFQLASANPTGFPPAWDRFMGNGSFFQQLTDARLLGMQVDGSMNTTLLVGMLFGFVLFSGFLTSVNIAAEVKEPQKNLLKGSLVALTGCVVIIFVAVFLIRRLAPDEWISAESFLAQVQGSSSLAMPWIPFYGAVLKPNQAMIWLVGVFWIFSILNMAQAFLYTCSRVFLAWVSDHVLPEWMGFIHPGTKSPLIGVLFVCIIAELGIVVSSLNKSIMSPSNLLFLITAVLILPILSVILLPFRGKTLFVSAPAWVKFHIGPIPFISILGGIALIYLVGMLAAIFTLNRMDVPDLPVLAAFLVVFFTGLVWYYGRRSTLLGQGENIDQIFENLPE